MTATAAAETVRPTLVLAVGFTIEQQLADEYRGRVTFKAAPDSVMKPEHVPEGTNIILMSSRCFTPHRGRLQNLAKRIEGGCQYEELSTPVVLQQRLEEIFDAKPAPPPAQNPPVDGAFTEADARLKIAGVTCRAGKMAEWVRDHITWPFPSAREEAQRLMRDFPELLEKFPTASEESVRGTIDSIVRRAGLIKSATEVTVVGETMRQLQEGMGAFAKEFAISIKGVADAFATLEEGQARLAAENARLEEENAELRADAEAYRKLRAQMLASQKT